MYTYIVIISIIRTITTRVIINSLSLLVLLLLLSSFSLARASAYVRSPSESRGAPAPPQNKSPRRAVRAAPPLSLGGGISHLARSEPPHTINGPAPRGGGVWWPSRVQIARTRSSLASESPGVTPNIRLSWRACAQAAAAQEAQKSTDKK